MYLILIIHSNLYKQHVRVQIEITVCGKLRYMDYSSKTPELQRGIDKGRKSYCMSKITLY